MLRKKTSTQRRGLFIEPPLGQAGITEAAAKAGGKNLLVGKRPMTKVRAVEKGEGAGLHEGRRRRRFGADTGRGDSRGWRHEVVHAILDVMSARAPCTLIQRAMHMVAELLPTVFGELQPA